MANKGDVQTSVSRSALNETIVYCNQFRTQVQEKCDLILSLTKQMEEEESLKGGDGDQIRESFVEIGKAASQLATSVEKMSKGLNANLAAAMSASQGRHGANANDAAKKAAKTTGSLAHKE